MDEIFKKFYARLKKEGLLKAALCAVAVSFGVLALTAFICWMTAFTPVWICPVTFAVSAALSFTLFYFLLFRPDFKSTAARMDALGLDERMITMHELAGNNSAISNVQRADAAASAGKLSAKMLKFCVPAIIIAFAAVGAALGATFVTVDALSEAGIIKSGRQIADEIANPPAEYKLKYNVYGNGGLYLPDGLTRALTNENEIEITVTSGEDGKIVRTSPDEGWFLAGWKLNDGNYVMSDDYRQDGNVTESATITAVYEELEAPEEEEGPTGPGFGRGNGDGSGDGGNDNGGLNRSDADLVIDGETNYGDTFEQDLNDAMQNAGDSLSSGETGIIGDFFDTIAP